MVVSTQSAYSDPVEASEDVLVTVDSTAKSMLTASEKDIMDELLPNVSSTKSAASASEVGATVEESVEVIYDCAESASKSKEDDNLYASEREEEEEDVDSVGKHDVDDTEEMREEIDNYQREAAVAPQQYNVGQPDNNGKNKQRKKRFSLRGINLFRRSTNKSRSSKKSKGSSNKKKKNRSNAKRSSGSSKLSKSSKNSRFSEMDNGSMGSATNQRVKGFSILRAFGRQKLPKDIKLNGSQQTVNTNDALLNSVNRNLVEIERLATIMSEEVPADPSIDHSQSAVVADKSSLLPPVDTDQEEDVTDANNDVNKDVKVDTNCSGDDGVKAINADDILEKLSKENYSVHDEISDVMHSESNKTNEESVSKFDSEGTLTVKECIEQTTMSSPATRRNSQVMKPGWTLMNPPNMFSLLDFACGNADNVRASPISLPDVDPFTVIASCSGQSGRSHKALTLSKASEKLGNANQTTASTPTFESKGSTGQAENTNEAIKATSSTSTKGSKKSQTTARSSVSNSSRDKYADISKAEISKMVQAANSYVSSRSNKSVGSKGTPKGASNKAATHIDHDGLTNALSTPVASYQSTKDVTTGSTVAPCNVPLPDNGTSLSCITQELADLDVIVQKASSSSTTSRKDQAAVDAERSFTKADSVLSTMHDVAHNTDTTTEETCIEKNDALTEVIPTVEVQAITAPDSTNTSVSVSVESAMPEGESPDDITSNVDDNNKLAMAPSMKSLKSVKSIKSFKSLKSARSSKSDVEKAPTMEKAESMESEKISNAIKPSQSTVSQRSRRSILSKATHKSVISEEEDASNVNENNTDAPNSQVELKLKKSISRSSYRSKVSDKSTKSGPSVEGFEIKDNGSVSSTKKDGVINSATHSNASEDNATDLSTADEEVHSETIETSEESNQGARAVSNLATETTAPTGPGLPRSPSMASRRSRASIKSFLSRKSLSSKKVFDNSEPEIISEDKSVAAETMRSHKSVATAKSSTSKKSVAKSTTSVPVSSDDYEEDEDVPMPIEEQSVAANTRKSAVSSKSAVSKKSAMSRKSAISSAKSTVSKKSAVSRVRSIVVEEEYEDYGDDDEEYEEMPIKTVLSPSPTSKRSATTANNFDVETSIADGNAIKPSLSKMSRSSARGGRGHREVLLSPTCSSLGMESTVASEDELESFEEEADEAEQQQQQQCEESKAIAMNAETATAKSARSRSGVSSVKPSHPFSKTISALSKASLRSRSSFKSRRSTASMSSLKKDVSMDEVPLTKSVSFNLDANEEQNVQSVMPVRSEVMEDMHTVAEEPSVLSDDTPSVSAMLSSKASCSVDGRSSLWSPSSRSVRSEMFETIIDNDKSEDEGKDLDSPKDIEFSTASQRSDDGANETVKAEQDETEASALSSQPFLSIDRGSIHRVNASNVVMLDVEQKILQNMTFSNLYTPSNKQGGGEFTSDEDSIAKSISSTFGMGFKMYTASVALANQQEESKAKDVDMAKPFDYSGAIREFVSNVYSMKEIEKK